MSIPLSPRAAQLIGRIGDPDIRVRVLALFETEPASFGPPTPEVTERIQLAVIRLAMEGSTGLSVAEALYRVDCRDLLVNAEFADDVKAHERWCDALLAGRDG
jgi:hypothetical protein